MTPKPLATVAQAPPFSDRPQSIHTLNSGNPQELATGGYESPIDNRQSYPPVQQLPTSQPPHQQGQYNNNVSPQQQNFPPQGQQMPIHPGPAQSGYEAEQAAGGYQQQGQGQYAAYSASTQPPAQGHGYPGQQGYAGGAPGGQYPPTEVGGEDASDYYR